MMIDYEFKDNTILIVNNGSKDIIIEKLRENNKFLNIKFMTIREFRDNYYFTYDEKAIYYLMNKYGYKYDVCVKYLNNLIYIEDKEYKEPRIRRLSFIKRELIQNNLLIFNKLFRNSLKDKNVVIYNLGIINKFDNRMFDEVRKISNVDIYNDSKLVYDHKYVYEFYDLEEEVVFVASKICDLVRKGININNIKICGINDEYKNVLKKIFSFFNIPIVFNDSSLFATGIGQDFINNFDADINKTFDYIENKYNLKDESVLSIYNAIVSIINKYAWCDDILSVRDLIIEDFKKKIINKVNLVNQVDIIKSLEVVSESDYVFLMNFNQGSIPETYKDEDYLNNKLKDELGIDNANDLNRISHDIWFNNIKGCKNLIITYKLSSPTGDFYLSSLNDELGLEIKHEEVNYNYSDIYNKIKLTGYIDNLIKYNLKDKDLELLYGNYSDIEYMTYNNCYVRINKDKLKKFINNKLVLSYSAINNYYHCAFRYYLSNILKINIYEETFYTVLGNLFHYILSICFEGDIDIRDKYYKFIGDQTYQFNDREKFFLDNLLEELIFVIDTIKEQYEYFSISNALYEDKIEIDKSRDDMKIIFKGFVDKIIMDSNNEVGAIIDYKTGNPDLNLNNIIYGLDLQLPVYVYLAKKKFPSIRIIGFYLQKILNNEISLDNKNSYVSLKKDKLKLQGYTNSDENLIGMIDSNYMNSQVIKGMRTTSKGISSKKILDDVKIDKLGSITDEKIEEAIEKILNGDFDINPKRVGNKDIGCKYCTYRDICFKNDSNIVSFKEYKNLEFLDEKV